MRIVSDNGRFRLISKIAKNGRKQYIMLRKEFGFFYRVAQGWNRKKVENEVMMKCLKGEICEGDFGARLTGTGESLAVKIWDRATQSWI
jgi:hypothetical protein